MSLACDGIDAFSDLMDVVSRFSKLCERTRFLSVHLNCFHGSLNETSSAHVASRLQRAGCTNVSTSSVTGMKGLFWKLELAPEKLPASAHYIWLVDADMAVDQFALRLAIEEIDAANASLAQPRIGPYHHARGRMTDWPLLRASYSGAKWPRNCLAAAMKYVEVQTPIFRRAAWDMVHRTLLTTAPSSLLAQTIWGISELWCPLLENRSSHRPVCAVLRSSILHMDTHLIERSAGMMDLRNVSKNLWRARRVWRFDKGFAYWSKAFRNLSIDKGDEFHRKDYSCLARRTRTSGGGGVRMKRVS